MRWSPWGPYVTAGERRARAARAMRRLAKQGVELDPIEVRGNLVARTFWGRAWCKHLEKFSDFANRLPRGRSYLRAGAVCHLEIAQGSVRALVAGSSLYEVRVTVARLPAKRWEAVKARSAGRIGSLLELLRGELSESVMAAVTDRDQGLFPLPREIGLQCDCPDGARMCKHVAAALYAVGARLDARPELLFRLRGVDHEELIAVEAGAMAGATSVREPRRRIADDELGELFGIDLSPGQSSPGQSSPGQSRPGQSRPGQSSPGQSRPGRSRPGRSRPSAETPDRPATPPRRSAARAPGGKPRPAPAGTTRSREAAKRAIGAGELPRTFTARAVARLRARLGLSRGDFARLLGMSATSVALWEKASGRLNLHAASARALAEASSLDAEQARARLGKVPRPPRPRGRARIRRGSPGAGRSRRSR